MCVLSPTLEERLKKHQRDIRREGFLIPDSPEGPDGIRRSIWERLDRIRMDMGMAPRVVAPPAGTYPESDEEARAADLAGAARCRLDDRIAGMLRKKPERDPRCGHGARIHLRREKQNAAGFQHRVFAPSCGRSSCPHCWLHQRILKSYKRSARALLDLEPNNPKNRKPRVADLHVGTVAWEKFHALDKSIRRRHGNVGRMRIRMVDDTVYVIADVPFPGSKPYRPAEALGKALCAIDVLNVAKHSFRLLGAWKDSRKPEWEKVDEYSPKLDLREAKKILEEAGAHVEVERRGKTGIFFGTASGVQSARLQNALRRLDGVSEFILEEEDFPKGTNSDKTRPTVEEWYVLDPADDPPWHEKRV
jgi:hypothetical protein